MKFKNAKFSYYRTKFNKFAGAIQYTSEAYVIYGTVENIYSPIKKVSAQSDNNIVFFIIKSWAYLFFGRYSFSVTD